MNSTIRMAAVVVGAVLLIGLGAMLLFRSPQLPEDNAVEPDAPTAAQKKLKPVDAPVERAATPTESEEDVSNAERKTAGESFRYSADRWVQMARNQLPPDLLSRKGMSERLERLREKLEQLPPEERYAYVKSEGYYVWEWRSNRSDLENRVRKAIFEESGTYHPYPIDKTPRSVIEILVEGMDDLTAARNLYDPPWEWNWTKEREYALEYVDRALEKDPTSLDALLFKRDIVGEYAAKEAVAFQLIEHHPNDEEALVDASLSLRFNYPEATVLAVTAYLDQVKGDPPNKSLHGNLGVAYERLGMLEEAMEQYQIALKAGHSSAGRWRHQVKNGNPDPTIWEERAAAAAESVAPTPGAESPPDPHDAESIQPDAPRPESPPPPPNLEAEMSAAYANFAKAYQSAFEMEYALSEATPEGYMNALLGMARAFAKAGDAQRAQDAYNAVRKRHSREEVEQVFRRFDEQERLKRQPPNEEEDGKDEADE